MLEFYPPNWCELIASVCLAFAAGLVVGYWYGRVDERDDREKANADRAG